MEGQWLLHYCMYNQIILVIVLSYSYVLILVIVLSHSYVAIRVAVT